MLKLVLNSRGKRRSDLLKTKRVQSLLREVCANVLEGRVPLSRGQKIKLRKDAASVRELARKKTSLKRRVKISQKGGFISALLGPVIGLVAKQLLNI